jgi:phenylpropionate dioxygenase-like ring-hydroxylating dioxygenase large terminal subunit
MLVTQQPVFRRYWHAVMPLTMLADGPKPFTLLGENIVLFLDEHGEPAALKDRCCHRTAKLSKGWCKNGNLQCGYHGWVYNRTGRVIQIPQYPAEREIPKDYATPAYHCTARYGYAWVALEDPVAEIPAIPEFEAEGWRTIFQFYETWHTSPVRALENSFDNSHFSFVHRATFGVAASPAPSKYELVENEAGFYAETVIDAVNPEKFQRISGVKDPITQRHMRNAYYQPFSRRLDIEYPSGVRHVIINAFTPIDDGRMQLCQWLFRNDTGCGGGFAAAGGRVFDGLRSSGDPDSPSVDGLVVLRWGGGGAPLISPVPPRGSRERAALCSAGVPRRLVPPPPLPRCAERHPLTRPKQRWCGHSPMAAVGRRKISEKPRTPDGAPASRPPARAQAR